jgi:hypothetical protein
MQERRAKTDKLDATELADLLRLDRLATPWSAPREIRELRELVHYRNKLVKASIHAVLSKCGVVSSTEGVDTAYVWTGPTLASGSWALCAPLGMQGRVDPPPTFDT